jgi:teichuronic acid biosynthesis glycosyltransferase TuaG
MVMKPVVSIVTPAFNAARTIGQAIQSAQGQTFQNWEMVVVDDCSTDDTCLVVKQYADSDSRVRLLRQASNGGPAHARNAALRAAVGRYIAFLDSDDIWLPEKLQRQLAFMQGIGCALTFTGYQVIREDGIRGGAVIEVPSKVDYEGLLLTNVIGCLTAVYDTEVVGKVYTPLIRKREDHALWLKILKMGHEAWGIDECLALRRIRSNSDSANKLEAAVCQWRMYRDVECLPFLKRLYCFANYAYHGYRKGRVR